MCRTRTGSNGIVYREDRKERPRRCGRTRTGSMTKSAAGSGSWKKNSGQTFYHFVHANLDSVLMLPYCSVEYMLRWTIHRKKRFTSFPSPAGMSLTKLPLGRNNSVMTSLFPPRLSLIVTSRLGTGNLRTFFYGGYCPLVTEFVIFKYFITDNITTNKAGVQNVISDWVFGEKKSQKVTLRKCRYIRHKALLHTHFLNHSKDLK
jgi:hypothetical protein